MIVGVGVCDKGEFSARDGKKQSSGYITWKHMIERCYDPKYAAKFPTYACCEVAEEFKSFQGFMVWATKQKGYGEPKVALDKDLLAKGNKIYSPDTCIFIPRDINVLLTKANARRGEYPLGVSLNQGRYMATLCYFGRNKNLGRFHSPEEAFEAYKKAKEAHIKFLASQYKDVLDKRAYVALQSYVVEITD